MSTLLARSIILVNTFKHGFVHSVYESATRVHAHLSLGDRLLLLASSELSPRSKKKMRSRVRVHLVIKQLKTNTPESKVVVRGLAFTSCCSLCFFSLLSLCFTKCNNCHSCEGKRNIYQKIIAKTFSSFSVNVNDIVLF